MKHVRWGTWAAALSAFALLTLVVRSVLSGPSTVPNQKDFERATRDAAGSQMASADRVAGNGRVEPAGREVRVSAAIAARIDSLVAEEGARVKAGDVLVELEATTERASLRSAEAELDLARASLAAAVRGPRAEEIAASVADAEAANARASLAHRDLDRSNALASDGAIAMESLDRARLESEAQQATARAAGARAQALLAGTRKEDIRAANAKVAAAAARVEEMRAVLDRLVVRSPIDGEVLQLKLRPGEYFDPRNGDALAIVGDTSKLHVRMDVDERDVGKVRAGATAYVTTEAFPEQRFEGRVVEVGRLMGRKNVRTDEPTERLDTKILELVIDLDRSTGLVPGMRVVSYVSAGGDAS